jgi:glycosyltransferase involved in cell wall biosynthesis
MNEVKNKTWLIMPTLNEAKNLSWLLPELGDSNSIVVVDNNSNDDSAQVAERLGATVVACKKRGYGAAVLAGLQYIESQSPNKNDIITIFDADGTSPLNRIPDLIRPLQLGLADLVIAQRTTVQVGAMPIHGKFGNWLTVTLIRLFTGFGYQDMGPMRAMCWHSFQLLKMSDQSWGWNVEMQMKAIYFGLNVTEIQVEYSKRRYGASKISGNLWVSIRAGSKILARTVYYYIWNKFRK